MSHGKCCGTCTYMERDRTRKPSYTGMCLNKNSVKYGQLVKTSGLSCDQHYQLPQIHKQSVPNCKRIIFYASVTKEEKAQLKAYLAQLRQSNPTK